MTLCDVPEQPEGKRLARPPDLPEGVPPLRSFYLYLSASCNLRCRHCWITPEYSGNKPQPGQTIDLEALRRGIAEGKTLGLTSAKLTGGEPMLHPRFMDIVDMLSKEGISLNMETNGTLLIPENARYLKEHTNVGFISVSIDSPVPKEHDAFRGVKGAFKKVVYGLDCLVGAGYTNAQVIMSVHRGNRHQIADLVQLAADHKAASVKLNPVTHTGRGIAMHERGESLDYDGNLELMRYVNEELRQNAPIPIVLSTPPALTPFTEIWRTKGKSNDCGVIGILGILGTGQIALCGIGQTIPELVYGTLGKDSIREIWINHPLIRNLRYDLEQHHDYPGICGACIHARSCRTGCVAHNYTHGGKLVAPNWLCEEAHQRNEFPQSRLRQQTSKA